MLAGVEIEVAGKPYNAGQGVFTYYVRIGDKTVEDGTCAAQMC